MLRCLIIGYPPASNALESHIIDLKHLQLVKTITEISDLKKVDLQKPNIIFADLEMILENPAFINLLNSVPYVVFLTKMTRCLPVELDSSKSFLITSLSYIEIYNVTVKILKCMLLNYEEKFGKLPLDQNDQRLVKVYNNGVAIDRKIDLNDILYVKASGNFCHIFMENNIEYLCPTNLKQFQSQLNSDILLRAHRTYLINVHKIRHQVHNLITLFNGQKIPIGRIYKSIIVESLYKQNLI